MLLLRSKPAAAAVAIFANVHLGVEHVFCVCGECSWN